MPHLFDPLSLRGVTARNRIGVSPMCQYSAENGFMTDWHLVHLGSRAIGGAGIVMVEATAVEARGRISLGDTGIYSDSHVEMLSRVAAFVKKHGASPAIQLAHAGRKASVALPWDPGAELSVEAGRWQTIAPSSVRFDASYPLPGEMSPDDIRTVLDAFRSATRRAATSGFEMVEIHAAHGYLLHEFLSPLSNKRTDEYGGAFENRARFAVETARVVRAEWPDSLPVAVRISCTDWADEGGWDVEQSVELAKLMRAEGIDLIDCSSGGLIPNAKIPVGPAFQTPFAERIRREAGIATAAVGMITEPEQADEIISSGKADCVFLARAMLRDPYWAHHAAATLGQARSLTENVPLQYGRAFS